MTLGEHSSNNLRVSTPQHIVFARESGNGIKINTVNPQFGWRDLLGKVTQKNTGATKPTYAAYQGNLEQYQFAVTKAEQFDYHIPHDYVLGTDVHLHVHWSHTGTFVTGGSITFGYEISYARGFSRGAFSTPVTGTIVSSADTTQYEHVIGESQISAAEPNGSQIDTDLLEPDGIIMCRVEVTSNDLTVSEGGVPVIFIHEGDLHIQTTSIGTKERDADFYREVT